MSGFSDVWKTSWVVPRGSVPVIGTFFILGGEMMENTEKRKVMLSGIKPSGQLTLGNYIGALRNFVKYQDEYEMLVFIANLHCITVYQDPKELKKNLKDAVALYLACRSGSAAGNDFLTVGRQGACAAGLYYELQQLPGRAEPDDAV